MMAAAIAAVFLRPSDKIAEQGPKTNLETLVPERFGDWGIDKSVVPVLPNEQQLATLNMIYDQTLSRTYVNARGYRVMLSIAYGGDQSTKSMQVHRPEVCYSAQGFQVRKEQSGELQVPYGVLPIKRILAIQGFRSEPITYWVTVGDKATPVGFRQKLAQLAYGLNGKIPDGMLVRVSSIDPDEQRAHAAQDAFIRDLLAAVSPAGRTRLAGNFGT
jgi:EpsI family protein